MRRVSHGEFVPAQCGFNIIERITDLCSQRFAFHTMNDVLILPFREFGAPAEELPKPDCWNMWNRWDRFTSHELFDSAGRILVHDAFRNSS